MRDIMPQNANLKRKRSEIDHKRLDFGITYFLDEPKPNLESVGSCKTAPSWFVHVPNLREEVEGAIHLLKQWGCPQNMQLQR